MNKILWLNSGGKDCCAAASHFESCHEGAQMDSLFFVTDFNHALAMARNSVHAKGCTGIEIDYMELRKSIGGANIGSTQWWGLEYHYRALQYALEHGYDSILSGSTNVNINRTSDQATVFDDLFNEIQDLLEVEPKVELVRPIKHEVRRDMREYLPENYAAQSVMKK